MSKGLIEYFQDVTEQLKILVKEGEALSSVKTEDTEKLLMNIRSQHLEPNGRLRSDVEEVIFHRDNPIVGYILDRIKDILTQK